MQADGRAKTPGYLLASCTAVALAGCLSDLGRRTLDVGRWTLNVRPGTLDLGPGTLQNLASRPGMTKTSDPSLDLAWLELN